MRRAIVLVCILLLAACDRTAAGTKEDPIPFTLEGVDRIGSKGRKWTCQTWKSEADGEWYQSEASQGHWFVRVDSPTPGQEIYAPDGSQLEGQWEDEQLLSVPVTQPGRYLFHIEDGLSSGLTRFGICNVRK